MNKLLKEIKERKISVLHCARLLGVKKRTMQYMFDVDFQSESHTEAEEKVKMIIRNHDRLTNELKK